MIGYDSAGDSFPAGGQVYLGYVSGAWLSYPTALAAAQANGARAVSIATRPDVPANELDVEQTDATIATVPGWLGLATAAKPKVYCSVATVDLLVVTLRNAGIPRERYAIHSAHWNSPLGRHVCGPQTCGACSWACDATQWAQTVGGPDTYDVSEVLPSFFGEPESDMISTTSWVQGSTSHVIITTTTPTGKQVLIREHYYQNAGGDDNAWHLDPHFPPTAVA